MTSIVYIHSSRDDDDDFCKAQPQREGGSSTLPSLTESSIGATKLGTIYTVGMYHHGLPELLVQDIPPACHDMVDSMVRRLVLRLGEGRALYTNDRVMEENRYCFRVLEVTHVGYRQNLLCHVMPKWWKQQATSARNLSKVQVTLLIPWFRDAEMEEWATLPYPPKGRHDRRDKIFLTALNMDCRGRPISTARNNNTWHQQSFSSSYSSLLEQKQQDKDMAAAWSAPEDDSSDESLFDAEDAAYFLKYSSHFLQILNVPDTPAVLYRMPPSFQRLVLEMGERFTMDAAQRRSSAPAVPIQQLQQQQHHHRHQQQQYQYCRADAVAVAAVRTPTTSTRNSNWGHQARLAASMLRRQNRPCPTNNRSFRWSAPAGGGGVMHTTTPSTPSPSSASTITMTPEYGIVD